MLYMELYEEIKERILDGRLEPGEKLPSKRQLAKDRDLSINTVENALGQLKAEGYLKSVERSGFYVLEQKLTIREPDTWDYEDKEEIKPSIDWRYKGVDKDFPFSTWRKISNQILNQEPTILTEKGPKQGERMLRKAIATYLWTSRGLDVSSSNILVDSSTENLLLTLLRMVNKSTIGVEDPGFQQWDAFLESNLIKRLPISLDEKGINPSGEEMEEVDMLFTTPSHQFPTGTVMTIDRKQELIDWAAKNKKWIIEDDYNGEFRFEGATIPPLKSIDYGDRVIYMGSFSTTISPALRVSFMVLPKELIKNFNEETYYFTCTVPRLTQLVLADFMRSGSYTRHINRMRRKYSKKRQLLVDWVNEKEDLEILGSNSGLHFLLTYKTEAYTEKALLDLAKEQSMALSPLSNYEIVRKKRYPTFVIGYSKSTIDELEKGMEILEEVWDL